MVRSTRLAVDAGLPDVLQTSPGWQEGPGPGSVVPGLRPRRALPRAGAGDRCTKKCAARQVAEPAQRVRPPVPAYSSGHFKEAGPLCRRPVMRQSGPAHL